MMTKTRELWIDVVKAILILTVVSEHIIQLSNSDWQEDIFNNIVRSFNMQMFFVLSGFTFAYNSNKLLSFKNLLNHIGKRSIQLLLPFVAWGFIKVIIYYDISEYLERFTKLFSRPTTGLWFLIVLYTVDILYSIVLHFLSNIKIKYFTEDFE